MATSNRDRIDAGLQLLGQGLAAVRGLGDGRVRSGRAGLGGDARRAEQRAARDQLQLTRVDDPRFLLTVLTDEWRLFKDKLSRAEQSFASELRDTGNKWAHGAAFSADDTYRALDTMERLLRRGRRHDRGGRGAQAAAGRAAGGVQLRDRRAVQVVTGVEGHGLKPWREVIMPHQDVRDGNMRGAEFAADLHYVVARRGVAGVRGSGGVLPAHLPDRRAAGPADVTARRISGDRNAPPVVNLQTNFGGGKTHSMLALCHLLSGTSLTSYPDELQKLLGRCTRCLPRGGPCWSGNHIAAGKGSTKPDGTKVRRCGASWPGSSGSPRAARPRRGGPLRWCGKPTRPDPTRAPRSAS